MHITTRWASQANTHARTHKQSSPNTRVHHHCGVAKTEANLFFNNEDGRGSYLRCSDFCWRLHSYLPPGSLFVFSHQAKVSWEQGEYGVVHVQGLKTTRTYGCSACDGNIMCVGHCIYMMGRVGTRWHRWETSTCILLCSHDSSPAADINYSIFAVTQWEKTSEVKDGGVCGYEREWAIWSRIAEEKVVWRSEKGVRANHLEMKPIKNASAVKQQPCAAPPPPFFQRFPEI